MRGAFDAGILIITQPPAGPATFRGACRYAGGERAKAESDSTYPLTAASRGAAANSRV